MLANKLKRVFITWRCLREKASISSIFSANVTRRRLLPIAFAALYHNASRQSHMRYCEQEIGQNRRFAMVKEAMLKWLQHHNLSRIEANMQRFYQYKLVKSSVEAWKLLKQESIEKRRNRLTIRRALKRKPELA